MKSISLAVEILLSSLSLFLYQGLPSAYKAILDYHFWWEQGALTDDSECLCMNPVELNSLDYLREMRQII